MFSIFCCGNHKLWFSMLTSFYLGNYKLWLSVFNFCRGIQKLLLSLILKCCRQISIVAAVSKFYVVQVKLFLWCLLNLFAVTLVGHRSKHISVLNFLNAYLLPVMGFHYTTIEKEQYLIESLATWLLHLLTFCHLS